MTLIHIFYLHIDASWLVEVVNLELIYNLSYSATTKQANTWSSFSFNISNYSIDRVKEATFLGVILVEYLTWKSHIDNVAKKVSKAIGIIYKSSFSNSSLWTLYYSLI